jgi:hypothetical protein
MPASRAAVGAALLTLVGVTAAGCGDNGPSGDAHGAVTATVEAG